jgi:protein-disulfide isomerase
MDEHNVTPPSSAPSQPAPADTRYRPLVVALLLSALIVGGSLMGSAMFLGDKIDALRAKLAEVGSAPAAPRGAGDEERAPAQVDADSLVVANDPKRGPADATVTIVEFSDYECPFCERFVKETMPQLLEQYGDKVQFVFKDFPLPMHPNAPKGSEAAHCAGDQGKYWEYHDKLFDNRRQMGIPDLKRYAQELNLDTSDFNQCLEGGKYTQKVRDNLQQGRKVQVNGTPTFFINGQRLVGAQPFEAFKEVIDAELNQ